MSKGAPPWKAYVEYVSEIVISGFCDSILESVAYLHAQVDPAVMEKNETVPLLTIELELLTPDIVFQPDIGESAGGTGIRDIFNSWLKGMLDIGSLMKRLDIGEGNYLVELEEDFLVRDAMSQIQHVILANEEKCNEFKDSYKKYEYLWMLDLQQTLKEFLEENAVVHEDGTKEDPTLERFDEEIRRYKDVQEEIQGLTTSATIGWIKVDSKPIKQALSTCVTKWIFQFTAYLSNKVTDSMEELFTFMDNSNTIILAKTSLIVSHRASVSIPREERH